MGHIAGTTFGIGTPMTYPLSTIPLAVSPYASYAPYAGQGLGGQVFAQQPYLQSLATLSQQLQQLQALQQQQLILLQQLLQLVPAQLQQLQQLIQVVPQQIQQLQQQWQPFGATAAGPLGFGLVPQVLAGQVAGHVM